MTVTFKSVDVVNKSVECQNADWKKHKVRCKHNRGIEDRLKEEELDGSVSLQQWNGVLRRWNQMFKPILNLVFLNALTLQSNPTKCETHYLTIVLEPRSLTKAANTDDEIRRSFTLSDVFVSSFEEALRQVASSENNLEIMIKSTLAESAKIRARGGLGCGVVMVRVNKVGLDIFTPLGFVENMDDVRVDKDWEGTLKMCIDRGITV
ncbi:hypothetical protein H0H93_008714 [Arthromyces matolae]|nr:hypothetical protein H0H93_008714 [Arthromyces matolae]